MTNDQLDRLGLIRETFEVAERSLGRALLHTPQLIAKMTRAGRMGFVSPATVSRALSLAEMANADLAQARVQLDAAQRFAIATFSKPIRSFGDQEGVCPKGLGGQTFGFGDQEGVCPEKKAHSTIIEVAFGDNEIPSPKKAAALPSHKLIAIERSITREINLAEGMVDRALICAARVITAALEERRALRLSATFGQDAVDQLLAASATLSKAFANLYAVHETLVEARAEAIAQLQASRAAAA